MSESDFRIDKLDDNSFRVTRTDVCGDLHTHLKSKAMCNKVISCVCNGKIPHNCRNYTLISMMRLSTDREYIDKINELLEVRKHKGKKLKYYRPQ